MEMQIEHSGPILKCLLHRGTGDWETLFLSRCILKAEIYKVLRRLGEVIFRHPDFSQLHHRNIELP